jgi:hypothetical protein
MRRAGVIWMFAMMLLASPALDACGDKFLLVGRGLAFGRAYASVYPGTILIYNGPATKPQNRKLYDNIRKAGHRVALVITPDVLSAQLLLQRTDIVIADEASRSDLERMIATLAVRPSVLYLVADGHAPTTPLPQEPGAVVKNGEKPGRFLVVLEDIMKARQQAGVRVKKG